MKFQTANVKIFGKEKYTFPMIESFRAALECHASKTTLL